YSCLSPASSQIPDPSSCSISSPSQGEGIEVRLRLAKGIGIQHFNSGSAYWTMRPGEESEARQPSAPDWSPFDQYARSTSAGPCSDGRIVTRMRVPSFGAPAILRQRSG